MMTHPSDQLTSSHNQYNQNILNRVYYLYHRDQVFFLFVMLFLPCTNPVIFTSFIHPLLLISKSPPQPSTPIFPSPTQDPKALPVPVLPPSTLTSDSIPSIHTPLSFSSSHFTTFPYQNPTSSHPYSVLSIKVSE